MAKSPISCGAKCSRITLITLNIIFLIFFAIALTSIAVMMNHDKDNNILGQTKITYRLFITQIPRKMLNNSGIDLSFLKHLTRDLASVNLCGIAFLILGCIFRFGDKALKDDVKKAFEDVEISGYNAYDLLNGIAIIFIVAGVVVILISFLGFVGACCTSKCALYIYCVLVGIVVVVELAGVILFFILNGEVEKAFKLGLKESIKKANSPTEPLKQDYQKSVEYMMNTYECCHVDQTARLLVPGSTITLCATASEAHDKDCYIAIKEWVHTYSIALIIIGICVILVQICMITFACCVARNYRKEELV